MQVQNQNASVWYEKYKPSCVEDLVIPDAMRKKFQKYVKSQKIPHLGLFSSLPGTGKSSTAFAIIKEINGEALWINASMEKGIDVLRGQVKKFASQQSFDDNIKIVVMDEFDNFSQDGQKAFRGFIDEYGTNCKFIFTGNYQEKIIEPLLERLEVYDFNSFAKEEMVKPIFERLKWVLDNEQIKYDPRDLVPVINTFYPKIRSMIGSLQKFSDNEIFKVQENELDDLHVFDSIMEVQKTMATYSEMITKVLALNAPENMISFLFGNISKYFKIESYAQCVILIGKYQAMGVGVPDKNVNIGALLTELIPHRI